MTSPTLVQEGDFVAVGDMGGKTVRVYNKEGMVYDLQAEGSPVQFALNETGYLSLITKNDSSYRICVYNRKGKLLKERVEESKGIYPLSSDVSIRRTLAGGKGALLIAVAIQPTNRSLLSAILICHTVPQRKHNIFLIP